jgi:hypothetical protein
MLSFTALEPVTYFLSLSIPSFLHIPTTYHGTSVTSVKYNYGNHNGHDKILILKDISADLLEQSNEIRDV